MTTTAVPVVRNRRYWLRLVRLATAAILLTGLIVILALGVVPMWLLLHPSCAVTTTPASEGFTYQAINIPNREGCVWRGYFIPAQGTPNTARNRVTIIAPPAYNGDAGATLYETKVLVQAGFQVLTFESVVCARGGVHSLGALEAAQIEDALAYLKQNSAALNVDLTKIALHGFSSAGASSIFAAARTPEIAAVLAEGNYFDLDSYMSISQSDNPLINVVVFAMRLTYRLSTGQDPAVLTPISAITHIPPRPLFLIYGSPEVERGGAKQLLAAAQAAAPASINFPKLWIVPGSGHGGYIYAGETEYARYAVSFYDCALNADCAAWTQMWEAQQ